MPRETVLVRYAPVLGHADEYMGEVARKYGQAGDCRDDHSRFGSKSHDDRPQPSGYTATAAAVDLFMPRVSDSFVAAAVVRGSSNGRRQALSLVSSTTRPPAPQQCPFSTTVSVLITLT